MEGYGSVQITTIRSRIQETKKLMDSGHWQKETDFCYSINAHLFLSQVSQPGCLWSGGAMGPAAARGTVRKTGLWDS
jgi:hypothetical protein